MASLEQAPKITDQAAPVAQHPELAALLSSNPIGQKEASPIESSNGPQGLTKLGFPTPVIGGLDSGAGAAQKPGDAQAALSNASPLERLASAAWNDVKQIASDLNPITPAKADTVLVQGPNGTSIGDREGNIIYWTDQNGQPHYGIQN